jgi:hypothetical protein
MGSGAADYDRVVALKGRHGFQEEVASKAKSFLRRVPSIERREPAG